MNMKSSKTRRLPPAGDGGASERRAADPRVLTGKLVDCGVKPPKSGKEMDLVQRLKERNGTYLQRRRDGEALEERLNRSISSRPHCRAHRGEEESAQHWLPRSKARSAGCRS